MNRYDAMRDRLTAITLGLVLGLGCVTSSLAQDAGPQIMPNYREADIRQIIEAVAIRPGPCAG